MLKKGMRVLMTGPALQYSNAGDRLLPRILGETILSQAPDAQILYVSSAADPRVARESPWLRVISPKREPIRLLWEALRCDAFVLGGAVTFHDHRMTMLKQAVLSWLCRLGGGRVVVNAASIQPIADPVCRMLVRLTYRASTSFAVRDTQSIQNALDLGIRGPVRRSPDPGVITPARTTPEETVTAEKIWEDEGLPLDRPVIAIAPHFFSNRGKYHQASYAHFDREYESYSDEVLDHYYESLASIADRLAAVGRIVFVPLCTSTPPGDDRAAAEWIRDRMNHGANTFSVQGHHTIDGVQAILARCDVLIASRLHGYAMAAGAGVPSLAIEFHPKMRGLAEDLGLTDWLFPFEAIPTDEIIACVESILADPNAARQRTREGVARVTSIARAEFLSALAGVPIDPKELEGESGNDG